MYCQPFSHIDKQDFLANYWHKKPCLFRNAFSTFPNYLSAEELAGLALEDDIESRLIQYDTNENRWSMEHGPFEQQDFTSLGNSHWTLLVQSVDSWVTETHELLDHF
ncbi:MAG: cupin domain-containing protein, partial [Kangiellaceae bacterium]